MTIKSELLAIKAASQDGILHAEVVVDWARGRADSAIHQSLDWDDAHAANAHRIWQVRRLIQLTIVSDDGAPQLVSLTFDRKNDGGYRSIDDVVKDRDLSAIMLSDALAELERIKVRYARVEQLTAVWKEVENVSRRGRRQRAAVESARVSA